MSDEPTIENRPDGEIAGHSGAEAVTAPETGPAVIARYLKTLPAAPGVYRMLNAEGDVIYVGKARSLKARVSNYARLGGHSNRIARMIALTASMEFVRVRTEAEALLLEANLIKRFRPRFNVLMRDDKSFPYILIADTNDAPQILKHRGARNKKGDYFGPFASAGAVDRTINMLQRAFLLRTCSDSVFESRTRPCLLYQIKRCAGPCTGEISKEDYQGLVDEAKRFLRGESQNVRRMYQRLMEEAAEKLEYEEAAKYRNRLWALAHVTSEQAINAQSVEEADVFAAHQEGGQTCIQVFFFRSGQNWGNRAYFPKADRALGAEEVLESFIAQFYDDKPVPRLILLSHEPETRELLAEALSTKAARKVRIEVPKRGDKTALVEHARQNAREALGRRLAESSSQRALLDGIAERFGLARPPRRVEVYDNSHIQGTNAVGAMIVAGPEGFIKNQYRKFNIKSENLAPGDDYAMMREVLTRRFKRLIKESAPEGTAPPPQEQVDAPLSVRNGEAEPVDASSPDDTTASTRSPGEHVVQQGEGQPNGAPILANAPHAATADCAQPLASTSASRITAPTIAPLNRRGADGIPFGTLSADRRTHVEADPVPPSEPGEQPQPGSGPQDMPAAARSGDPDAQHPQPERNNGPPDPQDRNSTVNENNSTAQPSGSNRDPAPATAIRAQPAAAAQESPAPAEVPGPQGRNSSVSENYSTAQPSGSNRDPGLRPAPAEVPDPQDRNSTVSENDDLFDEAPAWPDLVLVDGGAGQLAIAREVFDDLGIHDVALIGVAKGPDRDAGREHFHFVGSSKPVMLEPRDPVLYFVQRLRDEAHRFAIGTHRAKRAKAIAANPLDEIDGIGPARKRALLAHFGSAKAVSRAGPDDLTAVQGISADMARKIYDFFHEKRG
jgi:excinuclease ABC subunit C